MSWVLTVFHAALLVLAASSAVPPTIPMMFAEGEPIEIGFQIGTVFQTQILTALHNDTFYNTIMLPYSRTPKGTTLYGNMFAAANGSFPQYVDEIQGMANALGVTLEELMLWNFRFDWELLFWNDTYPTPACSDVYLNLYGYERPTLMAHNEDNDPFLMDLGYIVHARIYSTSGALLEEFTHYCYPGILCGNAYGFSGGMVMTQNALFPSNVNTKTWAIPRNFLSRALVSQTLEEMLATLNHFPCTSGFSLNVGRLSDRTVVNVEVSPDGISVTPINGYDYHFNMYLHLNCSEYIDPGSVHHLARINQLPVPTCGKDLLTILGDTADSLYPIFRNGAPPDNTVTLGTVLFDFNQKMMYVFRGNPAQNDPMMVFSLYDP